MNTVYKVWLIDWFYDYHIRRIIVTHTSFTVYPSLLLFLMHHSYGVWVNMPVTGISWYEELLGYQLKFKEPRVLRLPCYLSLYFFWDFILGAYRHILALLRVINILLYNCCNHCEFQFQYSIKFFRCISSHPYNQHHTLILDVCWDQSVTILPLFPPFKQYFTLSTLKIIHLHYLSQSFLHYHYQDLPTNKKI